ncbi:MAG TPA: hypothetical protein VF177_12750, partial [Anaerolineae bacterium]
VKAAERRDKAKDIVQPAETKETALFDEDEAEVFRSRWNAIQTNFVDEPRSAVEDADSLVAEVIKRIAEVFADERAQLEEQWSRGDDVSTEDLRITLQRYRSFFKRLLSV